MDSLAGHWIDAHAHIFDRTCTLVPGRRYSPAYEAPAEACLAQLDRHAIAGAVLVQPSFLGTDNAYLCRALALRPHCLRGIAMVEPEIDEAGLRRLRQAGVRGIRFNLIGCEAPDFGQPVWQALLARLAAVDFLVVVHAEAAMWTRLLPPLLDTGRPLVIDHLGRPAGPDPLACPGFRAILEAAGHARVWIKASAPYRMAPQVAERALAALLAAHGPDRLLWATDWPWTQHEDGRSVAQCLAWLRQQVTDPHDLARIAGLNAARLFGLPDPGAGRVPAHRGPV